MSSDPLRHFLATNQDDYAEFLQRFQSDPGSISATEATQRYRELMNTLPPDAAAQVHSEVLAQLTPDQRSQIAQGLHAAHQDPNTAFNGFDTDDMDDAATPRTLGVLSQRAGSQDPQVFDQVFGKNSPLSSPLGKILMAGLAAYLAKKVLGGQAQQTPTAPDTFPSQGGGLGDILGQVLGGGASSGRTIPTPSQSGGGLGDILGQVLGGGASSGRTIPTPSQSGGGLGDILGQVLGGGATTSSSGGLGDILGQVLGGGATTSSSGGLGDILGQVLGGVEQPSTGLPRTGLPKPDTTPTNPPASTDSGDVETPESPTRSHRRYK